MCDKNINNAPNELLYDCVNIGSGEFLYAGSNTVGNTTTFQFKSLLGGSGILVSPAASELVISSISTITNLPGGTGLVASNLPNATVKSLVAGTNIAISNDANTVTITNTGTVVDTVSNLGGGAEVLIDVLGDTIRARTLVGVGGTDVNQSGTTVEISTNSPANVGTGAQIYQGVSGLNDNFRSVIVNSPLAITQNLNDLTINDNSIQSVNNVVTYNYMQAVASANIGASYNSPSGLSSNLVVRPSYYEGNSSTLTPTTISYSPAPRYKGPAFIPFTTTATNGATNSSFIKLYPDLRVADDYIFDYILAASTATGQLYQINVVTQTENPMLNYDGTTVTLTNVDAIAQNINDNLLYYVLTTSNTTIRWYDWVDKTTGVLTVISTASGWTIGSTIVSMAYDNVTNNLYVLGSLNNSRIAVIPMRPYDRSVTTTIKPFGIISTFPQPYVQALGGVNHSIAIDEQTQTPFFAIEPTAGTGTVIQTNLIGSGSTTTLASVIPEVGATSLDMVWANSGRLYIHSDATNRLYRTPLGASLGNGFSNIFTTVRAYTNFTRCPYGIIA